MIAIGADHGGYALKEILKEYLASLDFEVKDFGTFNENSVDYPDIADLVCNSVSAGEANLGILVCGTGIGMNMCANKHKGIRAAQCSDTFSAKMTRQHNDANVLTLGGRVVGPELAKDIVKEFVTNEFLGGRHANRVEKMMKLEQ